MILCGAIRDFLIATEIVVDHLMAAVSHQDSHMKQVAWHARAGKSMETIVRVSLSEQPVNTSNWTVKSGSVGKVHCDLHHSEPDGFSEKCHLTRPDSLISSTSGNCHVPSSSSARGL